MAKHVIFLVHGAGTYTKDGKPNKDDAWFKDAQKTIRAAYDQYDFAKTKPFDKMFEFELIVYDQFFHTLVDAWAKGAAVYSDALQNHPIAEAIGAFFKKAGQTTDNFPWTNAADLILYGAFGSGSELVRSLIINNVRQQFSDALNNSGGKRWSVIAHSLGTAVAHDALAQMWMSDEVKAYHRAEVVAMIANLSKVLEDEVYGGEVYTSAVRPGIITEYYISALHRYDPIAFFKQFSPPSSAPGWSGDRFDKVHGIDHFVFEGSESDLAKLRVTDPITHKFSHYFAHPKVHLAYFSRARPDLRIDAPFIKDAADAYAAKPPHEKLKNLVKSAFDDVGQGGASADLSSFFDILKVIYRKWS